MIYNFDELSFQIVFIDRFLHKQGVFSVKERPYAALSFRVSGTGDFQIGDKHLQVKPGDVLFLPSNVPYEVEYSVSESIVIHLEHCNYEEAEAFSLNNPTEMSLLFHQMYQEWKERRSVNGAKSALYGILDQLEKEKNAWMTGTEFANCLQYIETHFCDSSLNIGTVCKEGFISVSSLQRMFLQQFGISPMQYVIKLRMNKAMRLLVENTHSVKEVAVLCGFSDEKYFSRAFKRKYGYPPSRLRDNLVL